MFKKNLKNKYKTERLNHRLLFFELTGLLAFTCFENPLRDTT